MDCNEYLGMELDLVLDSLRGKANDVEVQYTVPPHSTVRGVARILRLHSDDDKLILTVSYQSAGKEV